MTIARLSTALVLAASFALAAPMPALAKSPKKVAKAHYKAGKKLYKKGKYEDALKELMEANRLDPNATLAKNIVKTYEAMDNIKGAAAYLQMIVDSGNPKKAVKMAKKKLASYSEKLEAIKKEEMAEASKAAAAEAKRKAEEEAKKKAEEEAKRRDAEEAKRRAEEEAARAAEEEARQKALEVAQAEAEARAGTKRLVAYGSGGVGLAAVGSAVYFGMQALDARDEANTCAKTARAYVDDPAANPTDCPKPTYDGHVSDSESAALMSDISWVVGGAGLVTAVLFYVLAASETGAVDDPVPGGPTGEETEEAEEGGGDEEAEEGGDDKEEEGGDDKEEEGGDDKEEEGEPEANLMFAPTGLVFTVTF